jgi:hypothetical protein
MLRQEDLDFPVGLLSENQSQTSKGGKPLKLLASDLSSFRKFPGNDRDEVAVLF